MTRIYEYLWCFVIVLITLELHFASPTNVSRILPKFSKLSHFRLQFWYILFMRVSRFLCSFSIFYFLNLSSLLSCQLFCINISQIREINHMMLNFFFSYLSFLLNWLSLMTLLLMKISWSFYWFLFFHTIYYKNNRFDDTSLLKWIILLHFYLQD